AEAVRLILQRCAQGPWHHVSSDMAIVEIDANPDVEKRRKVRALLPNPNDIMPLSEDIFSRAGALEGAGFASADAVHLAAAEAQAADVLLTCDDRFLRRCGRSRLPLDVAN